MRLLIFLILFLLPQSIRADSSEDRSQIVLYYSPYCPYSQEVLNYLKKVHKNIPLKNVKSSQEIKDELKKIGGVLQVPCLVIDEQALYNSDAILNWIDGHLDQLDDS